VGAKNAENEPCELPNVIEMFVVFKGPPLTVVLGTNAASAVWHCAAVEL